MKKLFYVVAAMACLSVAKAQSVGVGTAAPDSAAVLDIFSTSKGVLFPRILDTANVTKPLEGLIIYNKNTRSPYYYNGRQWLSLGARLPTPQTSQTDRITYEISGTGFTNTEEKVFSISHGVSLPTSIVGGGLTAGTPNLSAFVFMKEMDTNSKSLNLSAIVGTKHASIEFKFYASGSLIPYASYRYKNIIIDGYQVSGAVGGGALIESISVAFENYGFKDWVGNTEFGFNVVSMMLSSY